MNYQDIRPQPQSEPATEPGRPSRNKKLWLRLILLMAILVIIGVGLFYLLAGWSKKQPWQAVFLANGQVYFGQIAKRNHEILALENIYYLQLAGPLQQGADAEIKKQQELSLVKLGNELHGPADKMMINWQQVLFWEDLKADSKVVKAIEEYEAGKR